MKIIDEYKSDYQMFKRQYIFHASPFPYLECGKSEYLKKRYEIYLLNRESNSFGRRNSQTHNDYCRFSETSCCMKDYTIEMLRCFPNPISISL